MTSHHIVQFVVCAKLFRYIRSELDAHTALRRSPTHLRLRIGPQQFAHQTIVRRLAIAFDAPQIVERHIVRAEQSTVHYQHLLVDAMAQRQPIVHLREHIGHLRRVFGDHLTGEAVHLVHVDRFVIAARQKEVIGIQQLEAEQREYAFDGERAAIDKVSVEQIRIVFGGQSV